jgi:outer membrane protein assembly factor BamA
VTLHRAYVHLTPSLPLLQVLLVAAALSVVPHRAPASPSVQEQQGGSVAYEVRSLLFAGNSEITSDELEAVMTTRETPGAFAKFLHYSISEALGRKKEYLDMIVFSGDLERLKSLYVNRGFREARIDTSLRFFAEKKTVEITITITEGYRSVIDTMTVQGLADAPEPIATELVTERKIGKGDPYDARLLEEEVKRILRLLYDNGYPHAAYLQDSSAARHYASTRNFSVTLTFSMGKPYRFGEVGIEQEVDTLRGKTRRNDITDDILLDALTYGPGDIYSLAKKTESEDNLSRLGVFELRRLDLLVPRAEDTSVTVPTRILIRPYDKHELAPDIFVSDEDGAFNIGTGLSYTNRNFLGGARQFTTRLRFRTQTIAEFPHYFEKDGTAVSNLDLTFQVIQPYVFTNMIKGSWTFSLIVDKQKPYRQNILRNKFGFSGRHAEFTTGYLDWSLESSHLQLSRSFDPNTNDEDIRRALRLLQEEQFNSILGYTIQRDKSNDLFNPSSGFIHTATIEEAGIFPVILEKVFSIRTPYTRFYRALLSGRWYVDLTGHRYSIVALKVKLGTEDKYGESLRDTNRAIPQTSRFFAGGGSSVRGWNSRGLIARGNPQFGGNFLGELSVEARINLLQALKDSPLSKVWFVVFLDAGNVWPRAIDFTPRTIAMATGVGLRYETLFGPFRIDWGLRLYDPVAPEGQRWVTQRNFLKQTVMQSAFHFGIGQAF